MGDAARFDDRFKSRIWRIVAASLAMGGVLWLIQLGFGPLYGMAIWRYFALAVTVLIGAASYFAFAQWWGGLRLAEIKGSLRRG
ncbi:MAG: lipid II flippase MurJ, partial [Pseudomonadota bacterium]